MKIKTPSREELQALVSAVGGPNSLEAFFISFYERMASDLMIGFFFAGRDLKHIAHMQAGFMLAAAGIARFNGKGPSTAHIELPPILTGHFDRRLIILREMLVSSFLGKLSPLQIDTWVQFEESFRPMIVASQS